jgi:hypothetical protein
VVLGAVTIEVARYTTIHTGSVLTRESRHAIEARGAARRCLDTALAFHRDVDARSFLRTIVGGIAGAAAREDTLLDRLAAGVVTTRFDANQTVRAIVLRLANSIARARTTKNGGGARSDRSTDASRTPYAGRASTAPIAAIAAGPANTGVSAWAPCPGIRATGSARRREQYHSKPSISHEGLLNNNFTEIFR